MEECIQFHPLHTRVGIKRIDAEEKPAGGIIIPDTAKEKPPQGENNTNHSAPALAYQPKRLEKLASIAVVRKCHRGQEICSQGQPAEYWYRVTSGTARRCVAHPDGRRQIVELCCPATSSALQPSTSMTPRWRRSPKIRSWPAIRAGGSR